MTDEQQVPALIAALIRAGVKPEVIEEAVARAASVDPGALATGGSPLVRAFAFEQARLLSNQWGSQQRRARRIC